MELTLQKILGLGDGVIAFSFTYPSGITWTPGQSIKITLDTLYGPEDHRFTIASAPHQGVITIATRPSNSLYKQKMATLVPGDRVQAYGIEGDFVWPVDDVTPVFVASGLGINPFYAMLAHRAHHSLPLTATLLYATRSAAMPYARILQEWEQSHPAFTLQLLPGQRIKVEHIEQHIVDKERSIYIAGPNRMVDDIGQALIQNGQPTARIKCDWFTGHLTIDA